MLFVHICGCLLLKARGSYCRYLIINRHGDVPSNILYFHHCCNDIYNSRYAYIKKKLKKKKKVFEKDEQ